MAHPRLTAEIGRVLGGRYRLIAPIGIGASAQVYLADDIKLRRRVAIKMLHDALAGEVDFLRRFRAEARAAAALSHPNVMAVYDWSGADPAFLVTEYLPGGSLRALLDLEVVLSPAQALNVGLEAARALDYAHRRGFVHRDVKPANLLFGEDQRLRIADFGLARALAEAAWTEPQGAVIGTARYAAPEQAKGEALTGKADVYALALVLVEAVTGTLPFVADTTLGTLMARVDQLLPVADALGPLQSILAAAGHPDPEDRIDARALALGLLRAAKVLSRPRPMALPGAMVTGQLFAVDADPTDPSLDMVPDSWGHGPERLGDADLQVGDLRLDPPSWVSSGGADLAGHVPVEDEQGEPAMSADDRFVSGSGPTQSIFVSASDVVVDLTDGVSVVSDEVDVTDAAVGAPAWDRDPEVVPEPSPRQRAVAGHPSARPKLIRVDSAVISPSAGGRVGAGPVPVPTNPDRERTMRRRWPWAILVLVLLAGAGGVAATLASRPRSSGPSAAIELPVPSVDGLTPAQARTVLEAGGWKVRESTVRRDGSAAGQLLAMSPRSGVRLVAGRTIALSVSAGQTIVDVPDGLVGRPLPEAQLVLTAAGLVGSEADRTYDEGAPKGEVLAVAEGVEPKLEKGSTVGLDVSKGPRPRVVPSGLRGGSVASASAAVEDVQLQLQKVQVYDDEAPIGQVVAVSPRPGTSVARGSTVSVQVSLGPELKPVPSVAGADDLAGAVAILRNAGFTAGNTSGSAAGKPTGTSPSAGTQVEPGSTINIVLG